MLSKPTLIISIGIFLAGLGLLYFLVIPKTGEIKDQQLEIDKLELQLQNTTDYFNEVNQKLTKLNDLDWDSLEKKIDSNFMSGPFYDYNMNAFLERIVLNSGLILNELSIGGNSQNSEKKEQESNENKQETSSNGELKEVTISLGVKGDYKTLKEFLNSLSNQFCIVDINKIQLGAGQSSSNNDSQNQENDYQSHITGEDLMQFSLEGNIYSK